MIIRNKQTKGGLIRLGYFTIIVTVLAAISSFNHREKVKSAVVIEHGKASYYGNQFIGRKTANGEVFTKYEYTCAHKTLPFGTKLKVTNLANNESIIVRVNDRGPFVRSRIVDLSIQGAKELGLIQSGVANVSIEVVHTKLSSVGNTRNMERIAVDGMFAYVDLNDTEKLDQVYSYLQDSDQMGYIRTERIIVNNPTDTTSNGTSKELNSLETEK